MKVSNTERVISMFDMRSIGKEIAKLRKEKNMTQVELADKLDISYQAVSNWERGDSMPDISKLTDLSSILGVSIDELLGNGKEVKAIHEVLETQKVDLEKNDQETLESVLPLMKPKQIEESTKENLDLPFEKIIALAPFLEEEQIDKLAFEAVEHGDQKDIIMLAPFMSQEGLKKLVDKRMENKDGFDSKWIIALAPFLDEEILDELAFKSDEESSGLNILALLPFMSSEGISKLVAKRFSENKDQDLKWLIGIAPFMEDDALDLIAYQSYLKYGAKELTGIAPFLSTEMIEKIISAEIEKNNYKEIMGLLPFSGKNMEEYLIKEIRSHFKKS